jgi:hypothetical protein
MRRIGFDFTARRRLHGFVKQAPDFILAHATRESSRRCEPIGVNLIRPLLKRAYEVMLFKRRSAVPTRLRIFENEIVWKLVVYVFELERSPNKLNRRGFPNRSDSDS